MASVFKRGKTWTTRVSSKNADGKREQKSIGGFRTKSEAIKAGNELELKAANGELAIDDTTPFPTYFWDWFKTYKASSVTDRTRATYAQLHRVLEKSMLVDVPLGKMDRRKYQQFVTEYGTHHAKSTMSKFNSLIHASVKDGVYDGVIAKDFVRGVSLVFDKKKTRQIDYLNIAETKTLSRYLLDSLNPNFTSKYMIFLAINSGMRLGEVQGLKWSDLNFNFKTISIQRSWNEEKKEFQPTKANSDRVIRVNKTTMNVLSQLRESTRGKQVFINQYGTVPTSSAVNKTLRACLKDCSIDKPSFHFHSLRHTHVAYLLSESVDLYIISKRLGHSDVSMTSRVYSYLIDEYKQKADSQIELSLDKLYSSEPSPNDKVQTLA
ncbi:tyrosine-type recombinase/integrase [Furfurilactobacillus sp. WILCCON 0119]